MTEDTGSSDAAKPENALFFKDGDAIRITRVTAQDIRFPTSQQLDGSDAMNPAPDYSAAYVTIETDHGPQGHGLTFTIGRGNEVCVAAVDALAPLIVGATLQSWRHVAAADGRQPTALAWPR